MRDVKSPYVGGQTATTRRSPLCRLSMAADIGRLAGYRDGLGLQIPRQGTSCGVCATIIYYFTKAIMRDRFFAAVTQ
jgi:hypothetical protein